MSWSIRSLQAVFRGVVFLSSEKMVELDQGANFGEQLSALANSWKDRLGGEDPDFAYTLPSKSLARKVTGAEDDQGQEYVLSDQPLVGSWGDVGSGRRCCEKGVSVRADSLTAATNPNSRQNRSWITNSSFTSCYLLRRSCC